MTTTTKKLVVLGAGTAGTMVVNKLRKLLPTTEWTIIVVDKDDIHDYQPGYLFIPFGIYTPEQIRKTKRKFYADGIDVAAAWALHLFFTPGGRRRSPRIEAFLASARRFEVTAGGTRVAVSTSKARCVVGRPRRRSSSSMHGRSSCTSE